MTKINSYFEAKQLKNTLIKHLLDLSIIKDKTIRLKSLDNTNFEPANQNSIKVSTYPIFWLQI